VSARREEKAARAAFGFLLTSPRARENSNRERAEVAKEFKSQKFDREKKTQIATTQI